jgi:glycosyltransferase involved in cell wall biosynthesis
MKPVEAMPAPIAGPLSKVAVVADVKGWAFDNIANNMAITLLDHVIIDIFYSDEILADELFEKIFITNNYDHVHFLWREPYLRFFFDDQLSTAIISGLANALNLDRATAIDSIANGMGRVAVTFGVYDHVYLDQGSINSRRAGLAFADGYAVSSSKLFKIYAEAYGIDPTVETPDGVDRTLFQPHDLSRLSEADRPLVVGWVGNSAWHNEAGDDPKGLETIVKPVIQRLVDDGLAIVADFADRKVRWRPRDEMPGYYNKLDVLLCASAMEGTPNPVLEAMACGVPVISTDVGIVSEVFGPRQREFIVRRGISSMAAAIRRLCLDRTLLTDLSQENLARIGRWEWASLSPRWLYLLQASQAERVGGRGRARTLYVGARCANLELGIENSLAESRITDLEARNAELQSRENSLCSKNAELRLENSSLAAKIIGLEASSPTLQSMGKSLELIEKSLQMILEVASWQRKMLRPIRWVWVKALPIRKQVAHLRRR